jgi:hypothetical protein
VARTHTRERKRKRVCAAEETDAARQQPRAAWVYARASRCCACARAPPRRHAARRTRSARSGAHTPNPAHTPRRAARMPLHPAPPPARALSFRFWFSLASCLIMALWSCGARSYTEEGERAPSSGSARYVCGLRVCVRLVSAPAAIGTHTAEGRLRSRRVGTRRRHARACVCASVCMRVRERASLHELEGSVERLARRAHARGARRAAQHRRQRRRVRVRRRGQHAADGRRAGRTPARLHGCEREKRPVAPAPGPPPRRARAGGGARSGALRCEAHARAAAAQQRLDGASGIFQKRRQATDKNIRAVLNHT